MKETLIKKFKASMIAAVLVVLTLFSMLPTAAADTTSYGTVSLSGGYQTGHFTDVWDLTAGDITLSFTYDGNGLVDDAGAHAWAELGVRTVGFSDFNPYGTFTICDYDTTEELIADGGDPSTAIVVGSVHIWNEGDTLYVQYLITDPDWVITETHLHITTDPALFPMKNGNPIPGHFEYKMVHDPPVTEYTYSKDISSWRGQTLYVAAHAVVMDISCYQTGVVYGIQRSTGKVWGIDVVSGTAWEEFQTITPPPSTISPNGLGYDAVTERMYYVDYRTGALPETLYFWDYGTATEYLAGELANQIAAADCFNGKYYYIASYPGTDDLYEVSFNPDGTIAACVKIADISGNMHAWTFDGDIAVKDGVVYGWGRCSIHATFEFFTYDLVSMVFTLYNVAYQNSLQLAFGSNGELYGHRSGAPGAFYTIDTTSGAVTLVTPTPIPANLYTDCASGMICEPYTETAWGDGASFPGKNWATYVVAEPICTVVTGAGVWLATDFEYVADTFDPDPEGFPSLDLDDKLILQRKGGQGEAAYNLPSVPPAPGNNHRFWWDRDGVDPWQNPATANTAGLYVVEISLHATSPTTGTAYMKINGLWQGFETDGNWNTIELTPAGMTFAGDMQNLQVFYGLYGYGATHSVTFSDIQVTQ